MKWLRLALAGAGLVLGGLLLAPPAPARAGPLVVKTMFMSLELRNRGAAQKVEKRIRIKFRDIRLIRRRPSPNPGGAEAKLADKADKIFLKVQKLLEMRPLRIKVRVLVLRDQDELNREYERIFKRKERRYPVSFYVHKYTTVFTHEEVINESILAHELAHAVIDHYFIVMPPRKVQEILATYCAANLNRFRAPVEVGGRRARAHVPNSGRLREVLFRGNRALLTRAGRKGRKDSLRPLSFAGQGAGR